MVAYNGLGIGVVADFGFPSVSPILLNYMNLRRVNTRGMAGANKHTLMAALCYNLKKYMKFSRTPAKVAAKAQTKSAGKPIKDRFFPLRQGIRSGTRLHLS